MVSRNLGWTGLQRREGSDFLAWVKFERVMSSKFDVLATALSSLLRERIRVPEDALDVWKAVPAVLSRCNDQTTYKKPGAASAYAWLHLLDRYVRTWLALEQLVKRNCLPMGKSGVRALDVGTGPGPAAFAIHDFYSAMVEYSGAKRNPMWRQPSHLTCIEFDRNTNHFRHQLAEKLFQQVQRESEGILSMCIALGDFGKFEPTRERKQYFEDLRSEEDEYFDFDAGRWDSERRYLPAEANDMAQSLHRYRLITFSNFLTTLGTVESFEPNLVDVLRDAAPGSVLLVLGGKRGPYAKVYEYVDRLATPSGFELTVEGDTVSCIDSEIAGRVFEEGRLFYEFLQGLAQNYDGATEKVRSHFESKVPLEFSSSEIRAYRK